MTLSIRVILSALVISACLTYALEMLDRHRGTGPARFASKIDRAADSAATPQTNPAGPGVVVPTAATKFAYRTLHTALPLPREVLVRLSYADEASEFSSRAAGPLASEPALPLQLSRPELCSHAAAVARANHLPIVFFANLIWQESNFNSKVVSRVGAQGIAQFMPATAVEYGLLNPFDPIHALAAAGTFLRKLYRSFGNLGLAAAAYNAGPQRLRDWMANRDQLPDETRNYVLRITSRVVEDWLQIKAGTRDILMPPTAPCVEVREALYEQWAAMQITQREFADAPTQLATKRPKLKRPRPQ